MCAPWFSQPLCSSPQFPSPTSPTSGLVPLSSVLSYDIMFSKAVLTLLTLGALWLNVSATPIPTDVRILNSPTSSNSNGASNIGDQSSLATSYSFNSAERILAPPHPLHLHVADFCVIGKWGF